MYYVFIIHFLVERHLHVSSFWVSMNKVTIIIVKQVVLWYNGVPFGYMTNSGIDEYSGRSIPNYLRNHHLDLQSGCITTTCVINFCYPDMYNMKLWNSRIVLFVCFSGQGCWIIFKWFWFSVISDSTNKNSLFRAIPHILLDYSICYLFSWVLYIFCIIDLYPM